MTGGTAGPAPGRRGNGGPAGWWGTRCLTGSGRPAEGSRPTAACSGGPLPSGRPMAGRPGAKFAATSPRPGRVWSPAPAGSLTWSQSPRDWPPWSGDLDERGPLCWSRSPPEGWSWPAGSPRASAPQALDALSRPAPVFSGRGVSPHGGKARPTLGGPGHGQSAQEAAGPGAALARSRSQIAQRQHGHAGVVMIPQQVLHPGELSGALSSLPGGGRGGQIGGVASALGPDTDPVHRVVIGSLTLVLDLAAEILQRATHQAGQHAGGGFPGPPAPERRVSCDQGRFLQEGGTAGSTQIGPQTLISGGPILPRLLQDERGGRAVGGLQALDVLAQASQEHVKVANLAQGRHQPIKIPAQGFHGCLLKQGTGRAQV